MWERCDFLQKNLFKKYVQAPTSMSPPPPSCLANGIYLNESCLQDHAVLGGTEQYLVRAIRQTGNLNYGTIEKMGLKIMGLLKKKHLELSSPVKAQFQESFQMNE